MLDFFPPPKGRFGSFFEDFQVRYMVLPPKVQIYNAQFLAYLRALSEIKI
jgi:hypothetical protein